MSTAKATTEPELISLTTILSLLATVAIALSAYLASLRVLPSSTSTKLRVFYIWHLADALTHFILEGSFLYNCFFTFIPLSAHTSDYPHPASLVQPAAYFLGHEDRLYGSAYGTNPFALLWQEYAKADRRWGGADLTVISLELLTVFGAGPIALYVSDLIRRGAGSARAGRLTGYMWFWATVLATGELYGGFMTFAPEWLSASSNLDTSNFMYLYLYLSMFNLIWVFIPLWVLYEAYVDITRVFAVVESSAKGKKRS